MTATDPRVTVLMAVHNESAFVADAIESILAQTFSDFELLVVDDASTDETPAILDRFDDGRLRILRNTTNIGLTASLNVGLQVARGRDYIARLDGDDMAKPDRLADQVTFLDRNRDVGIVGSSRLVVDEAGALLYEAVALETDCDIRWRMLLGNALAHPTVMMRRAVLDAHQLRYDESFRTAQDYELWTRLLTVTQAANLREPLVTYRRRKQGVSISRRDEQLAAHDRIAQLAIQRLLPAFKITAVDVRELRGRFGGQSVREPEMDPTDTAWVAKLAAMKRAFEAAYAIRSLNRFVSPNGAKEL